MNATLDFVRNATSDLADSISYLAGDLTGTRPHNIIDPCSTDSVIHKPSIPLCTSIPGGQLEEGTLIALIGTPNPSFHKRFHIDFILEKCEHAHRDLKKSAHARNPDETDGASLSSCTREPTEPSGDQRPGSSTGMKPHDDRKVAFHFNPRFASLSESDCVVMNSKLGEWGAEERYDKTQFPFAIGRTFKLMILVEKEAFRVAVGGKHCFVFKHRCDYRDIGRIHVEGNITVDLLEFRKELKYLPRSFSSSSSSPCSDTSCSSTSSDSELSSGAAAVKSRTVTSPTLPYLEQDLRLGKCFNIYIAGHLPTNFKRYFVINLLATKAPTRTIPFHLSIRPEQQMMVRNSMIDGEWSKNEEIYLEGPFPFELGTHFDLMICNKPNKISVAVCGQLCLEFTHRMESSLVDALEITGSQLITSIRYEFF